jgi:hypothetical protein
VKRKGRAEGEGAEGHASKASTAHHTPNRQGEGGAAGTLGPDADPGEKPPGRQKGKRPRHLNTKQARHREGTRQERRHHYHHRPTDTLKELGADRKRKARNHGERGAANGRAHCPN